MAVNAARANGHSVNEATAKKQTTTIGAYLESWRERTIQNIPIAGQHDTISYLLLGLVADNYTPDAATEGDGDEEQNQPQSADFSHAPDDGKVPAALELHRFAAQHGREDAPDAEVDRGADAEPCRVEVDVLALEHAVSGDYGLQPLDWLDDGHLLVGVRTDFGTQGAELDASNGKLRQLKDYAQEGSRDGRFYVGSGGEEGVDLTIDRVSDGKRVFHRRDACCPDWNR